MNNMMQWVSWKMPVIQPYSITHLCIVAGIVIGSFGTARLCDRKRLNAGKMFLMIGAFLAVTEVVKQLFWTYHRDWDYSWRYFPFQLCSIPMYLCLLHPVVSGKWQKIFRNFCMTYGFLGGVAALAEPTSCFTGYWIMTIHSLMWHGILLFLGFYCFLTFRREKKQAESLIREFSATIGLYLILSSAAMVLNTIFAMISEDQANLFFVGPSYPNIVILDTIYEKCGWLVESVSMVTATSLAAFLLFLGANAMYHSIKEYTDDGKSIK